jgi:hypothetical protein
MKSGNINFLEPSGPLQACNGTALPLLLDANIVGGIQYIVEINRSVNPKWAIFVLLHCSIQ